MGLREMILVLLSIVLFTRTALINNRGLMMQVDRLQKAVYTLQATNIAQRYMDEIDAKLYAKSITVDQISTTYSGSRTIQPVANDMTYTITFTTTVCDSIGGTASTSTYRKVAMTVSTNPASIVTYTANRIYRAVN